MNGSVTTPGYTLKHVLAKDHRRGYACDSYEVTSDAGVRVILMRKAEKPDEKLVVDRGRVYVENTSGRTVDVVDPLNQA